MGLNYEVVIQEELLSAYQRECGLWHITVIQCPLMHGLPDMYTLSPLACNPRVYISGEPLMSMV